MSATGKVVVDTSVVVAVLRRVPGLKERLRGAEELLVPLIVLGELEYGVNLATPPERQREAVRTFMESATLLLPTARTAAEYGRIKAALKAAGTPLPENDVWIAALALEHGLPLATRDSHFAQVAGLTVFDWR
ncbi:MAG: type II toxin-antitoxin system VapC family toxin [Opitutaceae bacterium]|nr:type II toxin-antitoxin system VapC family toxin [Opitutaceae bacterium]